MASLESAHSIFLYSNLDTRLAVLASSDLTIASLKRLVEMEHAACFPHIGCITVEAIKMKINGFLYHLSDSMIVEKVFEGLNGIRILHIDAVPAALPDGQQNVEKFNFAKLKRKASEADSCFFDQKVEKIQRLISVMRWQRELPDGGERLRNQVVQILDELKGLR